MANLQPISHLFFILLENFLGIYSQNGKNSFVRFWGYTDIKTKS